MSKNSALRITSPRSLPNLGLSICPGKVDPYAYSGPCARDLREDIRAIKAWGADVIVTLMERWELEKLGVPDLGDEAERAGIEWLFMEIVDGTALRTRESIPDSDPWRSEFDYLLDALARGKKVFVHCRGGLGRTGTLAARLLIEKGLDPEEAIAETREARKGAIETDEQERYLLDKAWTRQVSRR